MSSILPQTDSLPASESGSKRAEPPSTKRPETKSMVDTLARRFVVPVALFLDVLTSLIRIAETTIQLILPDVYDGWIKHEGTPLTIAYYVSALIVVTGISIGVTASLFLAMPLLYQINRRLDAALKIRNRRVRRDMMIHLNQKKKRYNFYVWCACSVPILFGASYFLAALKIGFLIWLTAAADIAAPLIILYTITQTEREASDIDPQERAVTVATDVVLDNVGNIRQSEAGLLRKEQAAMLKAGTEGDIEGMIDAATPRDDADRYYTISEICKKLGVPTGRDSSDRKRIWRIVHLAYKSGEMDIRRAEKGRGYLVPGKLFDKLFGDYQPSNKSAA